MEDILLSPDAAAELIGVCRSRVDQYRKLGRLDFEVIPTVSKTSENTAYRFRLSVILDFMEKRGATNAV